MIEIIKPGNKKEKFKAICPDCGCEFKYEQEDVKVDYSICLTSYPCKYNTYVVCPCCGKHLHHGYTESSPLDYPYSDIVFTTNETKSQDLNCDNCPNKPNLEKPVAGDSQCNWCKNRQPTCE